MQAAAVPFGLGIFWEGFHFIFIFHFSFQFFFSFLFLLSFIYLFIYSFPENLCSNKPAGSGEVIRQLLDPQNHRHSCLSIQRNIKLI